MEIVQEEYQDEWINLEKEKPVYFFVKRVIDIVLSLCGLIVLSPVFLLIAILIKKDDGGDVFYKHKRIGHMNQDIYLYKFRSMTSKYKTFDEFYQTLSIEQKEEWDENFKLENDPRITKIGNFLRKTSLDELPQIINILKGDMSIIGPRPVVDDEIEKYGKDKPIIVCMHYPPLLKDFKNSEFTKILEKYNTKYCIYGHLHGKSHVNVLEGNINGVNYKMASCDYTKFDLIKIV